MNPSVNGAYCSNRCSPLSCQHGGYADPNNCQRCKCPDGWGGTYCEEPAHLKNCGGEYDAYRQESFVSTPNYPNAYYANYECTWLFKTDPGAKVYVEFVDTFQFECKTTCETSYAEMKTGSNWKKTGPRYCCTRPTRRFESYGNEFLILMKGYGTYQYRGFKAKFWTNAARDKPTGGIIPPKVQTTPRPTTWSPVTAGGGAGPPGTSGGTNGGPGCTCGAWGGWGGCSQQCGGCGSRKRLRRCNEADCFNTEKRKCNFAPCAGSWLTANGEFHLLFNGCCIGLVKGNNGYCGGLENSFRELVSSFLPRSLISTG